MWVDVLGADPVRFGSLRVVGGGRYGGIVVKIQCNNERVVLSQLQQLPTLLETGRTDRWTERGGDCMVRKRCFVCGSCGILHPLLLAFLRGWCVWRARDVFMRRHLFCIVCRMLAICPT